MKNGLTYVVLADMDAFTAHCERHIDTVVNEKRDVVFLRYSMESSGSVDHNTSISGLVPILDDSHAALQSSFHDIDKTGIAQDGGGGVSDQVQRVVY